MIGYNPSHLNKNETLLEAFHRVETYLKANPQYQVYQSSAQYQEGTQEYMLDTIVVPEGSTVGKGDVVLFSNVYYAVITAVSETTFSIESATNFRGAQGEQGPKGDTGATGAKGETGLPALMYSKNLIYGNTQTFYTDLDGYNRPPQINDSCLYVSSNTDSIIFGIIDEIRPETQQVFVRKESYVETKGQQGEQGPKGENGKDGNATLLYAGELSESITTVETAQITRPQNRGILVKDILISTAASTFGAMAQVTALPVGVTTVDVSFIGTLESGGGGGTTLNRYNYNCTVSTESHMKRLYNIIANAKGNIMVVDGNGWGYSVSLDLSQSIFQLNTSFALSDGGRIYTLEMNSEGVKRSNQGVKLLTSGTVEIVNTPISRLKVVYYNDTEITA